MDSRSVNSAEYNDCFWEREIGKWNTSKPSVICVIESNCMWGQSLNFTEWCSDRSYELLEIWLQDDIDMYYRIKNRLPLTKAQELLITLLDRNSVDLVNTWMQTKPEK